MLSKKRVIDSTARWISRALLAAALLGISAGPVAARDWYVSAARGKGKKGTKKKPAKDLGNIIKKLAPGDIIHIAAGTYFGKGKSGADVITVPVQILGGYDDSFAKRDPWGAHRTVLTGINTSKNYKVSPRLLIDLSKYRGKEMPAIVVEGLIIDQAGQNRYATSAENQIVRSANPKTGQNPTPSRGALVISLSKTGNFAATAAWKVRVANNVIMNSAPTKGALMVRGYKNSKIHIHNNAVINNTGSGIYASSAYANNQNAPQFIIENNSVLFTWKYDAMASSFSGVALEVDNFVQAEARNNVFAFADRIGIQKSGKIPLKLVGNTIVGSLFADYYEAADDSKIALEDIEDEAEYLHEDSENNEGAPKLKIPVDKAWAKLYGARVLVDRNAIEADIKATQSDANALRSMLGLPLRAGTIAKVGGDIWLNRLSIDSALAAASRQLVTGRGSRAP